MPAVTGRQVAVGGFTVVAASSRGELAHTQPRLMIELLEEIRARLNQAVSGSSTELADLEDAVDGSSGRAFLELPPVGPADVLVGWP
jgi:hypothetical protein